MKCRTVESAFININVYSILKYVSNLVISLINTFRETHRTTTGEKYLLSKKSEYI